MTDKYSKALGVVTDKDLARVNAVCVLISYANLADRSQDNGYR